MNNRPILALGCGCLIFVLGIVFFSTCLTGFIIYQSVNVVPKIVHEIPHIRPKKPKHPKPINIEPIKPKPIEPKPKPFKP